MANYSKYLFLVSTRIKPKSFPVFYDFFYFSVSLFLLFFTSFHLIILTLLSSSSSSFYFTSTSVFLRFVFTLFSFLNYFLIISLFLNVFSSIFKFIFDFSSFSLVPSPCIFFLHSSHFQTYVCL